MPAILTSVPKVGNVLKHEYRPDLGLARTAASSLDTTLTGSVQMNVGAVVWSDLGDFSDAVAYNNTNYDAGAATKRIGVLIDEAVYDYPVDSTIVRPVQGVAILVAGEAIAEVRAGGLSVDSTEVISNAIADLRAAGLKVNDTFATDAH
jgi:hypothetical protein